MVEFLRSAFSGGLTAVETFVGSVGVMAIITFFLSIFKIVYDGKKQEKKAEEIKNECEIKLVEFTTKYQVECEQLKAQLDATKKQLADMVLLDIKKNDISVETAKAIIDIYKEVQPTKVEEADQVLEEKEALAEEEQKKQNAVNEALESVNDYL